MSCLGLFGFYGLVSFIRGLPPLVDTAAETKQLALWVSIVRELINYLMHISPESPPVSCVIATQLQ